MRGLIEESIERRLLTRDESLAVSVIVPVYNEVESLPHLIAEITKSLTESGLSYDIICVDDG